MLRHYNVHFSMRSWISKYKLMLKCYMQRTTHFLFEIYIILVSTSYLAITQTTRIYRDLHLKSFCDNYFYFMAISFWVVFMISNSNDRMLFVVWREGAHACLCVYLRESVCVCVCMRPWNTWDSLVPALRIEGPTQQHRENWLWYYGHIYMYLIV